MSSKGVALVTGAGQGIGRAIALRLADDGFDVAVNDLHAKNLETLVEEIRLKHRKSSIHVADVTVDEQVQALIKDVVKEHGGLDVMVANAGIALWKTMLQTTADDWDKIFAVNVKGTFLCYKYAGAQMIAQGRGGRIIGASSVAGKKGSTQMTAYSASKFAVRGLTQSAAQQLGQYGITVNAYAPGVVANTPMFDGLEKEFSTEGNVGTLAGMIRAVAPIRRDGGTADVAGLVSYLASKEAGFIT
ncbi:hypothetical protein C0991_000420, partial [Blastosporella zonata]